MKNKKFLITAIILITLLAAIILIAIILNKKPWNENANIIPAEQNNSLDIQSAPVKSIYEDIKTMQNISIEKDDGQMWWVSDDGYSVLNEPYDSIKIIKQISLNKISDNIEEDPDFYEIVSIASKNFESYGYSNNERNYSGPENEYRYYDFIKSYKKNSDICSIVVSQDISGLESRIEMYISCANNFDENLREQKPFLDALNLKNKNAVIIERQNVDNYYNIGIGFRRTGHYAIIRKNNGVFEKIYAGQEYPECKLMEEYNVPVEIYDKCWDGNSVIDGE